MSRDGREILISSDDESADANLPAFLAKPDGAPIYHGFPVIEESETDGWKMGAISEFENADVGDAFVIAPDGSRAGLVWEIGEGEFTTICKPEPDRWGVFAVWFPRPIVNVEDFIFNFRHVLPLLRQRFEEIKNEGS